MHRFLKLLSILALVVMIQGYYCKVVESRSCSGDKEAQHGKDDISKIIQKKCITCHSEKQKLPLYAKIPGIKEVIEQDFREGLRAVNLDVEVVEARKNGAILNEAVLAKLEWVLENNTMPPQQYRAVHWSTRVTERERKNILKWIKEYRKEHFSTGLSSEKRANEACQPLPESIPYNAQKAVLGEKLFNDKRLSKDNSIACASCHNLEKGGADNTAVSIGVNCEQGEVNTPTVFNAVFNVKQFWDGKANDLKEQAGIPPLHKGEMASASWEEITDKLEKDVEFTKEFMKVYPEGWSGDSITDAIAEYERTLITPNSRFDFWLKGDDNALSVEEIEGYELFKKYRCATCHVGKQLGGQSFEALDRKEDYFADRGDIEPADSGRMNVTKNLADYRKFKVPTLRNVELTAPYMHDGTVETLEEAVEIMGKYVVGVSIPKEDRDKIVLFMKTLTGEYNGKAFEIGDVESE